MHDNKLISSYLKEMGVERITEPSVHFLFELTSKHMLRFGWDTIDLHLQRKISLEPENIIRKFIKEKRGGVCYETAIAFCYLLNQLGFNAHLASAYTHGYNDHVFSFSIDTHIVIIATIQEKKHLVDVSWDPPEPILLTDMNYFNHGMDKYRLCYENLDQRYYLEKYCSDLWKKQYAFTLMPCPVSIFCKNLAIVIAQSEYDTFKKLKIMKLTPTGSLALFDKTFIIMEHGQQKVHSIACVKEVIEILKTEFLIAPEFVELYF